MGRVNTPILDDKSKIALEEGMKNGKKHAFRKRCQLVLLKSEHRTSKEVGLILKMSDMSVNGWLARYKSEGIDGLKTKPGRGRKPVLTKAEDEAMVLEAVKSNRQRLDMAKAEFEEASGKSVSRDTLRRFLKVLVVDSSEYGVGAKVAPIPRFTNTK